MTRTRTGLGPLFTDPDMTVARAGHRSQQAGAAAGLPKAAGQARWILETLLMLGPKTREELVDIAPRRLALTEPKACARLWRLRGNAPKDTPAFRMPPVLVEISGKRPSAASDGKVDVHVYALTDLARRLLAEDRRP